MAHLLPTEILESILSNLDTRTLLLAQLISRRWRDLIATSPLLQQLLFMQPAPPDTSTPPTARPNPLLPSIFPRFWRNLTDGPGYYPPEAALFSVSDSGQRYFCPQGQTTKTPLPSGREGAKLAAFDRELIDSLTGVSLCLYGWAADHAERDAFHGLGWFRERSALLRPEASWRRMYAVQPPARTFVYADIFCDCGANADEGDRGVMGDERPGDRLRLGMLFDMVVHFLEADSTPTLCCLDWFVSPPEDAGGDGAAAWCPAVLVRNPTWYSCSKPSTECADTGIKIADFDETLIRWLPASKE